jgi:very-short-patch-repair endonuclease
MSVRSSPTLKSAQRRARQQAADDAAGLFLSLLRREGLPTPVREHQFHDSRQWRFDYAWPSTRVALEVEGGAFAGGRHTRGAGFREDLKKYNEATRLGWRVLRLLPEQLDSLTTVLLIRNTLYPDD